MYDICVMSRGKITHREQVYRLSICYWLDEHFKGWSFVRGEYYSTIFKAGKEPVTIIFTAVRQYPLKSST